MTSPLIDIIDHETSYEVLYSPGWRWQRKGEGSDLSIRFHPSFSEDTVWAVFWADYFGQLDLFFPGLRTAGKALGREALRTGGKILTDIVDKPDGN